MLGKPVCIRPLNIDTKPQRCVLNSTDRLCSTCLIMATGGWQVHQASILQAFLHITMREIVPLALKSKVSHGKGPPSNGLRVGPFQQAARTLGPQPLQQQGAEF